MDRSQVSWLPVRFLASLSFSVADPTRIGILGTALSSQPWVKITMAGGEFLTFRYPFKSQPFTSSLGRKIF